VANTTIEEILNAARSLPLPDRRRLRQLLAEDELQQLLYVRKNYFSVETLRNANVSMVNRILAVRNPRLWGEGHACASNGKRFERWCQNLMTEWRSRYKATEC
jgi:TnpA family transposase